MGFSPASGKSRRKRTRVERKAIHSLSSLERGAREGVAGEAEEGGDLTDPSQ